MKTFYGLSIIKLDLGNGTCLFRLQNAKKIKSLWHSILEHKTKSCSNIQIQVHATEKPLSQQWETNKNGLNRDLNPGPLAPKARIIPLDHWALFHPNLDRNPCLIPFVLCNEVRSYGNYVILLRLPSLICRLRIDLDVLFYI